VRFAQGGAKALVDGSRAPHSTPQRTEEALERLIVSAGNGRKRGQEETGSGDMKHGKSRVPAAFPGRK